MSIEDFSKTRIQDSEKAQEEANMIRVEVGGQPTAQDYDEALEWITTLEEEAVNGSVTIDKLTKPLRNALAVGVAAVGATPELLALSVLNLGGLIIPAPRHWKEHDRQELRDAIAKIPEHYQLHKENLSSARERLEVLRSEAEKLAQAEQQDTK